MTWQWATIISSGIIGLAIVKVGGDIRRAIAACAYVWAYNGKPGKITKEIHTK